IGARVLDREATGAEVDFVRREFEKLSSEVERSFADKARAVAEHMQSQFERFLGEDSGAMAKALDSHSEELGELIARHFGGDRSTAVQHQLRELMSRALQESRADLLRQFSAEDGHNPLASFTSTVRGELRAAREKDDAFLNRLAELRAEIQRLRDAEESRAELEAERERGTAKGRSFEEACFGMLESMASARGDVAHHVGDERSASGGKLGDVVIELEAAQGESRGRIAVEVKDEQLSKNRAWEVLNGALRERDAAFAVLVVASDDKVPAGREPLHEYEGNKMIVALDRESLDPRPLELAYRYARCRCLMARERSLQVDAAGVRDAAEEALSALKDAQRIRVALTGATKSVGSAREYLDAMVERVQSSLERVERLIATGED
ncbi:MAG TPA: hypothetical protein VK387_03255, partial [Thermoleophilaceae bacterium]|nr:hypothetical protein [Thermoleophilaceae bacterium]